MEKKDTSHTGEHESFHHLSDRFIAHANAPQNLGPLENANGTAKGIGHCGDSVEIFLSINGSNIKDVTHVPQGCAYTIACASAVTTLVRGHPVKAALKITPEDVANELGGLPKDHQHCAALAVNTLGEAIEDYYHHVWGHGSKDRKKG